MPKSQAEPTVKAATRVSTSAAVGILVGVAVGIFASWTYTPLAFWDGASLTFLIWIGLTLRGRNAEETARLATREDPGRAAADILLTFASVASLGAIGALLWETKHVTGMTAAIQATLSVVSVVISWTMVHVMYMLRYAREYYSNDGGVDFNAKQKPRYSDFAYLAFTVGMTFQVSDTQIEKNTFRCLVLRHALLSYLFGTVIVAVSINVVAGLVK